MASIIAIKKEVIEKIKPSQTELADIENSAKNFVGLINKELKKKRIDGNAFLGGSIAKNTLIKKEKYDIDLFVRFSKKYENQLSSLLHKVLENILRTKEYNRLKIEEIKGSRLYFQINLSTTERKIPLILEIVPVLKINKPEEAKNVTDLSYFHVNYILKQVKKQKNLTDEIRLAKAFCYSADCYGAESYIKGFSGYSLEILVSYYKTFENFVRNVVRWKDKEIIDPEKKYKKNDALKEINESKLMSPAIIVDPTFKERNILAALSYETLEKFKLICIKFIKSPSENFFEKKGINEEDERKKAKKSGANLSVIEIYSDKDKEDIAAAKIIKFSSFLASLAEKSGFKVFGRDLNFSEFSGKLFLIYKNPSGELIIKGPPENLPDAVKNFKKEHKRTFNKTGFVYAKEKRKIFNLKDLISLVGKRAKEMSINKINILK